MTDYSDEQIEALIAAATPEPWCYYGGDLWCNVTADEFARADRLAEEHDYSDEAEGIFERSAHVFCGDPERREDAAFIAAARELVPSLLARAQQAEAEADRLRAELAEVKAESDERHQLIWKQAQLLTGAVNALRGEPPALTWWSHHDVAERAAEVAAERNRLAAQVAAARAAAEKAAKALQWLPSQYTVAEENSLRVVSLLHEDVYRIGSELRAAHDGTEQDEAKAPIRATCSGGGPSTEPGMALIEFRVPQGTERRLGAEWLLTPVSRPTEGDEQ